MSAPARFTISYDRGAYKVSIPNYVGGEVVRAELADALVKALELARKRIEYYGQISDRRHFDHDLVEVLPQIDAALSSAKQDDGSKG